MYKKCEKLCERSLINQVAADFYVSLYLQLHSNELLVFEDNGEGDLKPNFLETEVKGTVDALKDGKAAGHNGITNERIKCRGKQIIKISAKCYNKILRDKNNPSKLENLRHIFIFKNFCK